MSKALLNLPVKISEGFKQMLREEAKIKSDKMKLIRLDKSDPEYQRIKGEREALAHGIRVFRQLEKANRET